jgi:hypothetical protein
LRVRWARGLPAKPLACLCCLRSLRFSKRRDQWQRSKQSGGVTDFKLRDFEFRRSRIR